MPARGSRPTTPRFRPTRDWFRSSSGTSSCSDPIEAVRDAEALADPDRLVRCSDRSSLVDVREAMAGNVVFDGRNMLDPRKVEAEGLAYMGVGRTPTALRRRSTDR